VTDVHVTPSEPNEAGIDYDHELVTTCWCQPLSYEVLRYGRVVLHRRYIDGPVRDPDDDKDWQVVEVDGSA
jgi:hypothetical protein